jgi:hypothetical protein
MVPFSHPRPERRSQGLLAPVAGGPGRSSSCSGSPAARPSSAAKRCVPTSPTGPTPVRSGCRLSGA